MDTYFSNLPLVDHHCHSIVGEKRKGDAEILLRVTSEAPSNYPISELYERPIWSAVLTYVSRYTGVTVSSYEELSSVFSDIDYKKYCESLFRDAGYEELYVDTGYAPAGSPSLSEFGKLTGTRTYPILRLEAVAEEEFLKSSSFSDWWENVQLQINNARSNGYIGAKSIAAYRSGLALHSVPYHEAQTAFEIWKSSGNERLTDDALLNFLVWESAPSLAKQGLPLQFHTGYGDPDTDLLLGNPLLLRNFIETFTVQGLRIALLHTYPYHREAGYLASVYEGVYFDTSLIIPLGLTAARKVVSEALELAPYTRYLFASDAHTRPEMYAIAADVFKDAFEVHLRDPILMRFTSPQTIDKWARLVCHDNARNLYPEQLK